jgi:hypothetical protein
MRPEDLDIFALQKILGKQIAPQVYSTFPASSPTTHRIITNFSYPNGDSINLYLVDRSGIKFVSDLGSTAWNLRNYQINVAESLKKYFITDILNIYEVVLNENGLMLEKPISQDIVRETIQLLQCITVISNLEIVHKEQANSLGVFD